jgi:hypothetical protein
MNITVGYWRTRRGKKVKVLSTDGVGEYPVVGQLIEGDHGVTIESWTHKGDYVYDHNDQHSDDLVEPWVDASKLIPHWPALVIGSLTPFVTRGLYPNIKTAREVLGEDTKLRLATEYPPIMLEVKT